MTHEEFNCENCGKKPVVGNLYKCANCEDYNLCEQCYTASTYDHFAHHLFLKLTKPLKFTSKNPTILLQVLDQRLFPSQSSASLSLGQNQIGASVIKKKDDEDLDDL
jgi:predicted ATP-dependent serine protease